MYYVDEFFEFVMHYKLNYKFNASQHHSRVFESRSQKRIIFTFNLITFHNISSTSINVCVCTGRAHQILAAHNMNV